MAGNVSQTIVKGLSQDALYYLKNKILAEANTYTNNQIDALVDGAPAALDTLNEIAQQLSCDNDMISSLLTTIGNKVDKETGKGLSTNDYTTAEKNKLANIAAGAEVNVQSDWDQTTTTADDYIKNKPTNVSAFTNDSGYITSSYIIDGDAAYGEHDKAPSGYSVNAKLQGKQDTLSSGVNIKTINNQSLLGSGNINIVADSIPSGSAVSYIAPSWNATINLLKLSNDYVPSVLENEDLELSPNDTYEVAFGKLHKAILDNEQITTTSLNDLNSRVSALDEAGYLTTETDPTVQTWAKSPISISGNSNFSPLVLAFDEPFCQSNTSIKLHTTDSNHQVNIASILGTADFIYNLGGWEHAGDDSTLSTIGVMKQRFAQLNSPALTGIPTAPTANTSTTNTQIATTAFVHGVVQKRDTFIIEANATDTYVLQGTYNDITAALLAKKDIVAKITFGNDIYYLPLICDSSLDNTEYHFSTFIGIYNYQFSVDIDDGCSTNVSKAFLTRPNSTTTNAIVKFDSSGNIANTGVTINDSNHVTATKFITSGGTSSQFLKADGSVDSTTYQAQLVSGTNIKTINNESILGSGNITIQGGGTGGDTNVIETVKVNGTALTPDSNKAVDIDLSGYDKAPLIIEVGDSVNTVPAGTHASITTALAAERQVFLRVIEQDDGDVVYYTLTFAEKYDIENDEQSYYFSTTLDSDTITAIVYNDDSFDYTRRSLAPWSHTHGNITSGGDITASAPTIANGDQLIINDHSASKITNGPTFDGSTTTKALTQKGTWETFLKTAPVQSVNGQTGAVSLALGDTNVVETIKVNNTALTPVSKAVNITVPVSLDDLQGSSSSIHVSQDAFDAKGTYSKPSGGIPKTDLATAVQTSLGLADTALQPSAIVDNTSFSSEHSKAPSGYAVSAALQGKADTATTLAGYGITDAKIANGVITLGSNSITPLTSHQSIKTINNNTITGTGNITIATPGTLKTDNTTAQTTANNESLSGVVNLHKISKTGNYNDLIDKPTIPAAVTESTVSGWGFTKNVGIVTSVEVNGTTASQDAGGCVSIDAITGVNYASHPITATNGVVDIQAAIQAEINASKVTIYSGTAAPSNSQGTNGDLYLQTS